MNRKRIINTFRKHVWNKIPTGIKVQLQKKLSRNQVDWIHKQIRQNAADILLVSFPKCGRTWLRVMMNRLLTSEFSLEQNEVLDLHRLNDRNPRIPRIYFYHEDDPHKKDYTNLNTDKSEYAQNRVIFLVRDPRDVVVSWYFHRLHRAKDIKGDIDNYLLDLKPLKLVIEYYNIWAKNREVVKDFHCIYYEDMHDKPKVVLQGFGEFVNLNFKDSSIDEAIQYSSFSNMRKMETSGSVKDSKLDTSKVVDVTDSSQLKTRSGRIGGYAKHLSERQIKLMNQYIIDNLDPYFKRYYL